MFQVSLILMEHQRHKLQPQESQMLVVLPRIRQTESGIELFPTAELSRLFTKPNWAFVLQDRADVFQPYLVFGEGVA